MEKILYRHNMNVGETPTDALSVIVFETKELGNTDILEYCLEHYNFPSPMRSLIEGLKKNIEGDNGIIVSDNGYPFIIQLMLSHISKETGKDIKHVLWLASKQSVMDNYEGNEYNIEAYETSFVVLSDLGEDGILFGYAEKPKQYTACANKNLQDKNAFLEDLFDVLNGNTDYITLEQFRKRYGYAEEFNGINGSADEPYIRVNIEGKKYDLMMTPVSEETSEPAE